MSSLYPHFAFGLTAFVLLPLLSADTLRGQEPEPETPEAPAMRGFRFTSREDMKKEMPATPAVGEKGAAEAGVEASSPKPPTDAGGLKVGIVSEQTTLPPGLTLLAQEGALAVADRDWEEARKIYLEMIALAPNNALAFANLGVAEHQLGNLLAASGNLGKSIDLNPHIARNWQTLGLINYERGELVLAISNLTRAIHEAPRDAESRLILAAVVRDYGWLDAAVTELQRAVEIDPTMASAHYNLAVSYLDMKPPRRELARRHYYAAIDLGTPASPEIEATFKKSE